MQPVVRSLYLKIGLVVIKFPNQPVVRVMALLAFLPEYAFMDIVMLVTIITFCFGILECRSEMTGFATGHGVLTNQREISQVVVVANILYPPCILVMTAITLFPQLFFVSILVLMATVTGFVGFLFRAGFMAGLATGVPVCSFQREFCFFVVIKGGF